MAIEYRLERGGGCGFVYTVLVRDRRVGSVIQNCRPRQSGWLGHCDDDRPTVPFAEIGEAARYVVGDGQAVAARDSDPTARRSADNESVTSSAHRAPSQAEVVGGAFKVRDNRDFFLE